MNPSPHGDLAADDRPKRRILVVDQHAASRTTTSIVLTSRGHLCQHVDSTASAIAAVDEFRPDVVIYEWNLRGDDAVGLPQQLKTQAKNYGSDLLVIAVSTAEEPDGFSQRERVDAYFTKPVRMGELEREIDRART